MAQLLDLNAFAGVALLIAGVMAFVVAWELIERGLRALGMTFPDLTAEEEDASERMRHW